MFHVGLRVAQVDALRLREWAVNHWKMYGAVPPKTATDSEYAEPMLEVRWEVGKTSAIIGASSAPPAATATTAMVEETKSVHGRQGDQATDLREVFALDEFVNKQYLYVND